MHEALYSDGNASGFSVSLGFQPAGFSGRTLNIDRSVRLNISTCPFPFGW